jgi:hypothetical protein
MNLLAEPWTSKAQAGDLVGAAVEYIRVKDYVSFPELQRMLSPYIPTEGDLALEIQPHLLIWANVSEEFADIMRLLQAGGEVERHPASILTYLADGGMLTLPVAKRVPNGGYKTDHWIPTVFRVTQKMKNSPRSQ